jgi:hypothetical protein
LLISSFNLQNVKREKHTLKVNLLKLVNLTKMKTLKVK